MVCGVVVVVVGGLGGGGGCGVEGGGESWVCAGAPVTPKGPRSLGHPSLDLLCLQLLRGDQEVQEVMTEYAEKLQVNPPGDVRLCIFFGVGVDGFVGAGLARSSDRTPE